jgi:SNF2 family DNA or RNA helicase
MSAAHWIRNPKTLQFHAVQSLQTTRRWCLTGTPIQNRMEDLGTLVRFLNIRPFTTPSSFQKHVIGPLFSNTSSRAQNLRLLLKSMCLRRKRSEIQGLTATKHIKWLELPSEERTAYSKCMEDSLKAMDYSVSTQSAFKKCFGLFQAISRLRILCNLGTFQKGFKNRTDRSRNEDQDCCALCNLKVVFSTRVSQAIQCKDCLATLCAGCFDSHCLSCNGITDETLLGSGSALSGKEYSTKLYSVVSNIEDTMHDSKRYVASVAVFKANRVQALFFPAGPQLWTC